MPEQARIKEPLPPISPVVAAQEMIPTLRAMTGEINALGKLPPALFEQLDDARLFAMLTPKKYGGLEVDWQTYMDTLVAVARGNGSASWVLAIINTVNWMVARFYAKPVADMVFATGGGLRCAGVQTPRRYKVRKVQGGIHIDHGFWPFNSGIYHANWDALGVPSFDADGNEGPMDSFALLPVDQVKIQHDWNVSAMRGTGSSSVIVEDVFVPDERIASISFFDPHHHLVGHPSYRSAFMPIFALTIAFPVLGMGYGALDIFLEQMKTKKILYSRYDLQKDMPVTHLQLGDVSARLDASATVLRNAVAAVQGAAERNVEMDIDERARLKRDASYSNRTICEAIDILATASGASLGGMSNAFTQYWQDLRVGHVHAILMPTTNLETYGRMMVGLDPETPFL